jgi:hypothetical protein
MFTSGISAEMDNEMFLIVRVVAAVAGAAGLPGE